jgi:D-alanine-D-alanine ligase
MAEIPCVGSDALTLSLSLDKAWANRWLANLGIPVAPQILIDSREAALDVKLPASYPLFVKPRWEGTAKGIRPSSRVESREDLAREVERIVSDYDQSALVEAFVPGAEYTVTLIGNDPPRVLPVLQRALERETGIGLHAVEKSRSVDTGDEEVVGDPPSEAKRLEYETPGVLTAELEARLAELSVRAFQALDCRDFARIDFRLDRSGEPIFLEINPLPTFAPDGSFGILAELEGCSLNEMLGRCIQAGLVRLGLDEKEDSNE